MYYLEDNIGYIELLEHMGSDIDIVNAARVSFNKESKEFDNIKDKKLIEYLAKHGHWTPFSQNAIKLRIKIPIFIARQYFKHQIGFTRNETSRRYVNNEPEFYIPKELRKSAEKVKQGSSEEIVKNNKELIKKIKNYTEESIKLYNELIENQVCNEQARIILPQSMYTEFIETANLQGYFRLYELRIDSHAQKEIQKVAKIIDKIMNNLFPIAWTALKTKKMC
jgi:thymidylate synthase (FAD)